MGTPDFAVPTLGEIVGAGHEIVAVYTQPPRPAGRGMKERPSPVQTFAEACGLTVLCPTSLKSTEALEEFIELLGMLADEVEGHGRSLVTAYTNTSGARSWFTSLWRLDGGLEALTWPAGIAVKTRRNLSDVVRTETVDLLEPLPYSKLR